MTKRIGGARRLAALAVVLAVAGCTQATPPETSLYERLGGLGTITDVVDRFVGNMAADQRIAARFSKSNLSRLKIRIIQLICEESGGPCKYQGQPMAVAHKGMGITEEEFDASIEDLGTALDDIGVAATEKEELLVLVGALEVRIVGK